MSNRRKGHPPPPPSPVFFCKRFHLCIYLYLLNGAVGVSDDSAVSRYSVALPMVLPRTYMLYTCVLDSASRRFSFLSVTTRALVFFVGQETRVAGRACLATS